MDRFERTVRLPTAVDAEQAEAKVEDGVLTLTIPRSEAAKPKQIRVA